MGGNQLLVTFSELNPLMRTPFLNKDNCSVHGQMSTEVGKGEGRYTTSQILALLPLFKLSS